MRFSGKLVIIAAVAVTVLLISNVIAAKPLSIFELPFEFLGSTSYIVSIAIICFPLSYIISDVLTEVYGFRVARGVIWLGFACNLLMVVFFYLGGIIPGAVFWEDQEAYNAILGTTGWVLVGFIHSLLDRRILQCHGDGRPQEPHGGPPPVAPHYIVHSGRPRASTRLCSTALPLESPASGR